MTTRRPKVNLSPAVPCLFNLTTNGLGRISHFASVSTPLGSRALRAGYGVLNRWNLTST